MELMRASKLPQPVKQSNLSFSRAGRDPRPALPRARPETTCSPACRAWCASSCSTARAARRSPADIGDDNPAAVYIPGHHAHGYEALTDCLFLYHVTEEYDAADPDEHGVPWNDPRVVDLWSTTIADPVGARRAS